MERIDERREGERQFQTKTLDYNIPTNFINYEFISLENIRSNEKITCSISSKYIHVHVYGVDLPLLHEDTLLDTEYNPCYIGPNTL